MGQSHSTTIDYARAKREYDQDGVTLVHGVFEPAAIAPLLPLALEMIAEAQAEQARTGFPVSLKNLWRRDEAFRRFVFESPAAGVVGRIVHSRTIAIALDQIWAKSPRSRQKTRWHADRPAWPVHGMILPSLWAPLTPVLAENCLEFVAGSHRIERDPQATAFTDYEDERGNPAVRFLRWDLNPGDALVFHPMTYHGCHGNTADMWRVAFTTRWLGDDIRYDPALPYIDEGLSFAECEADGPLGGALFPTIWRAS